MVDNDNIIVDGSWILIAVDSRRRWVVRVEKGGRFVCDKGYIDFDDVVGLEYGSIVSLSSGVRAVVYRPTIADFIDKVFVRRSQIIYPKDASYIIVGLGVGPGMRVLEIGVGSGAMTSYLANAVRPDGLVYSYEVRADMIEVARRNLEVLGLLRYVVIKHRDASKGVDERDLDAAFIDIGDPWSVVDPVYTSLKPGSSVCFFMPTVNQVDKLYRALHSHGGWGDIRVVEVLERGYEVRKDAIRPYTRMVGHTGYMLFARKRLRD
jgi:tRNA (adenine57-N1/adenine58-N1)-methyltransferase